MSLHSKEVLAGYKRKIQIVIYVAAFFFLILFFRFFYLQILKGGKFLEFSEKNRISIQRIKAKRGKILDRNGLVIADNRPSFDLAMIRGYADGSPEGTLEILKGILDWDLNEQGLELISSSVKKVGRYDPAILKKDISRDELAKAFTRMYWLNGLRILDQPVRYYPYGSLASHVLGYLSEIDQATLRSLRAEGNYSYRLGDYEGKSGVEKLMDSSLKGVDGAIPFIEDARGRDLGEEASRDLLPAFRRKDPKPGRNVYLTIDLKLQKIAEEAFDKEAGAVVAMQPGTGEILAMVSRPSFEPARFTRGVPGEYWKELILNPQKPLYDRALRGHYPPGSTFKIVTAIAALAEGIIDPEFSFYCPGTYRLGRETKRCWKRSGHGLLKLREALVRSCDVYFYELGRRVGIDTLARYARLFGLGSKTGIGMNHESPGLVPDSKWKERVFKKPWVGGETLSVAVGQGFLTVTPIQMASLLSAVVNGGKLPRASIVKKVEDYNGNLILEDSSMPVRDVEIEQSVLKTVKYALFGVVNEPGGTAYWTVRSKEVEISGKTGTAQVVRLGKASSKLKSFEDHAWFVAFAPYEKPEIVLSVLVEHGGHGSSAAGPIAKRIMEGYFRSENKDDEGI